MEKSMRALLTAFTPICVLFLAIWGVLSVAKTRADAQGLEPPSFKVDPSWPNPLPGRWLTGDIGGMCIDSKDHLFVVYRGNLTPREKIIATLSPPVLEFDQDGRLVNSWGNAKTMPDRLHGCFADDEGNIWITGTNDGVIQKYSHDGSKLLMQIGVKGLFDSVDGRLTGEASNSSHTLLNGPSSITVDPTNGNLYVADGFYNRRVVVFDRAGKFLRQWGRQAAAGESDAGVGGVFERDLHCIVLGNDALLYVCDKTGNRVEVFDKTGNFLRNVSIESKTAHLGTIGSASCVGFSGDLAQKFMYVADGWEEEIRIIDHATGQVLSTLGKPGRQAGEFTDVHSLVVNSKGDIITGEGDGQRIQMFRLVDK